MKILFYTTFIGTPFFETELELMHRHIENGDEVYISRCGGQFQTCLKNPNHRKIVCSGCQSMFVNGLKTLPNKKYTILTIPKDENNYGYQTRVFNNVEELMDFKINDFEIGLAVTSSLVHRFLDHKFDTIKYQDAVDKEIRTAFHVYNFFEKILVDIKPDKVYFFNGRFSTTRPVIALCQLFGIDFVTHERGGMKGNYSLFPNSTPHDLEFANNEREDLWQKAGNEKYDVGKQWFVDRRNKVSQAFFSFTKNQKTGLLPERFGRTKRNIAIYNSTIEEYFSFPSWKNPVYKNEIDGLYKVFESFKFNKNIRFYLRLHPNLMWNKKNSQLKEIYELAESFSSNLEIIAPDSPISSYDLMDNCNCVLTFGSTMALEACFWGKPSILVGRGVFESLDCFYKPQSHKELIQLLETDLKAKNKDEALKYGFWESTRGISFVSFKQPDFHICTYQGRRISPSLFYRFLFFGIRIIKSRKLSEFILAFKEF